MSSPHRPDLAFHRICQRIRPDLWNKTENPILLFGELNRKGVALARDSIPSAEPGLTLACTLRIGLRGWCQTKTRLTDVDRNVAPIGSYLRAKRKDLNIPSTEQKRQAHYR
jgi:hypothetical protein